MALATTMQRGVPASTNATGRRQPRTAGASRVVAIAPRSRTNLVTQAFYLRPYSRGSCRPSSYSRSDPSRVVLHGGLGLLNSMLASDWLREATSSVHPMDINSFDDRYEIKSDCPGMDEEDVEVEVSSERVLTIAGSRKTPKRTSPTSAAKPAAGTTADPPETIPAASTKPTYDDELEGTADADYTVSYRFRRSFMLPEDAEVEGVAAALDRGVLTVTVPRRVVEKPKPRRVSVKGSK